MLLVEAGCVQCSSRRTPFTICAGPRSTRNRQQSSPRAAMFSRAPLSRLLRGHNAALVNLAILAVLGGLAESVVLVIIVDAAVAVSAHRPGSFQVGPVQLEHVGVSALLVVALVATGLRLAAASGCGVDRRQTHGRHPEGYAYRDVRLVHRRRMGNTVERWRGWPATDDWDGGRPFGHRCPDSGDGPGRDMQPLGAHGCRAPGESHRRSWSRRRRRGAIYATPPHDRSHSSTCLLSINRGTRRRTIPERAGSYL